MWSNIWLSFPTSLDTLHTHTTHIYIISPLSLVVVMKVSIMKLVIADDYAFWSRQMMEHPRHNLNRQLPQLYPVEDNEYHSKRICGCRVTAAWSWRWYAILPRLNRKPKLIQFHQCIPMCRDLPTYNTNANYFYRKIIGQY